MDPVQTDPFVRAFVESGSPLSRTLPELQRVIMARDCKIEPVFGCQYYGMLPRRFPKDEEIANAIKRFMYVCMRSYVSAMKRAQELRLEPLKTSGGMSNELILEFYETCMSLYAMPETKRGLRTIYEEVKQPPFERVKEIQESVFPMLGYTVEYGIECLQQSQKTLHSDMPRMRKQQLFMMASQIALREATFTAEERKAYYGQMPTHLHNTPQIFEMMVQHQQMQMQQQNSDQSVTPATASMLKQQEDLAALLASDEGKDKMMALSRRMNHFKTQAAEKVSRMSKDERVAFFDEIDKSKVVDDMARLSDNKTTDSPMETIDVFLTMSDEDLSNIVTLQAAVQADAAEGGDLGTKLAIAQKEARVRNGLSPDAEPGFLSAMMGHRGELENSHSHDEGHGHRHGGHCTHDHGHNHAHGKGHAHSLAASSAMER